ncbi:hypothetical protein HPB51_004378 [Rhipicephalus microplus]|uniref:Udp-galactose transporter n=1 Tax=Rhipicephalus microplus TaxID=6941 RepID=A0A9J6EKY5_RHIMP|nr:hypothetical protein HPB51_004378 [Rhipicephalus microplus]
MQREKSADIEMGGLATYVVLQMANILKYTSLLFIVIQTTTLVLLLRYSRTQAVQGPRYLSSSAVVCAEFLKIITCVAVLLWNNGFSVPALVLQLRNEVWRQPFETSKMLVPAGLYTIQNNLLFYALSLLDAATYQVTYQLKILTTAMFSVWMLKRRISKQQWFSLVLLIVGVALVQMPTGKSPETDLKQGPYQFLGLLAVLASCLSSGFSGIYLEKLLKEITWSLWIRNIQLAIFGFLLGIVAMLVSDWNQLLVGGFFQGYNAITWMVILLQTFGGLVVSLAVRYADSILKGFATSISIVLSTLCSYYLLGDLLPTRTTNSFVVCPLQLLDLCNMLQSSFAPEEQASVYMHSISLLALQCHSGRHPLDTASHESCTWNNTVDDNVYIC